MYLRNGQISRASDPTHWRSETRFYNDCGGGSWRALLQLEPPRSRTHLLSHFSGHTPQQVQTLLQHYFRLADLRDLQQLAQLFRPSDPVQRLDHLEQKAPELARRMLCHEYYPGATHLAEQALPRIDLINHSGHVTALRAGGIAVGYHHAYDEVFVRMYATASLAEPIPPRAEGWESHADLYSPAGALRPVWLSEASNFVNDYQQAYMDIPLVARQVYFGPASSQRFSALACDAHSLVLRRTTYPNHRGHAVEMEAVVTHPPRRRGVRLRRERHFRFVPVGATT